MTMTKLWKWLLLPPTDGSPAITLIRLMTGSVFLWEGVLKFVYVNQGVGRFTKLGFPAPAMTAEFVGWVEIFGGMLLLAGLLTRFTAIVFVIQMLVAMASTKVGLFLGTSPLPPPPSPPIAGMWAVLHEVRSEYAQLLTCAFLLIVGPGRWSLDALLGRRAEKVRRDSATGRTANGDRLVHAANTPSWS
jgi:putative oxidoreductase